jgi:hypothetical protein
MATHLSSSLHGLKFNPFNTPKLINRQSDTTIVICPSTITVDMTIVFNSHTIVMSSIIAGMGVRQSHNRPLRSFDLLIHGEIFTNAHDNDVLRK